ncbi:MAG: DUF3800 domain-containing protein [Sphingomonadaceae bacterium]|nr:DUF3800 domain-containing protein [Sphingomonadaceae bacterium]|tara:strand:+ start:4037 stop:4852 length:816 start_codon:yes stop_codon:yes gene_type:complete
MHLLYCDETNLEERAGDFLIYGGLMIDGDRVGDLNTAIDELRTRRGVPRDYHLKFNPGPSGMDHQDFIAFKREVIQAAHDHDAKLLVYVILHDIAVGADEARRNGINAICHHFHCALNRIAATGLVLIDRFNDAGNAIDAHLREKFSIGLRGMPYGDEMRLPTIVGYHYSAIGQSHMPSLVDVALGTLRFALNAHTRTQQNHIASARAMIELLAPLFWRENGRDEVSEIGFMFSPKIIKRAHFRQRYEDLKGFLADNGVETAQPITDERRY